MDTKPNWTPIVIRLGDIIPWEHNPRMSNKAQAQRLIESERKFGQPLPFQVSPQQPDGKYKLYDGHQRYGAWLTVYGENHKVAASMCDRELTEDERLEYVITMHAGATGQWDWQKMANFPAPQLIELGFDGNKLREWNMDALNLREMLTADNVEMTLDELAEQYGATGERDFWPFVKIQVSPETYQKYTALMKDLPGADDAERFDALISRGC